MTTKDQERQAIEEIRKIVEGLGENSYVGFAMEGLDKEIKRAEATTKVATTIINNENVQLNAMKHMDEYGYNTGNKERKVPAMLVVKENA